MANFSNKLLEHSIFSEVAKSAQELGVETYVVGGYVRDTILERASKDIDFVCVGNGLELAKKVASNLKGEKSVSYFKNFGTAAISYNNREYEFVGARKESYSKDSRNPIVKNGSLSDDQNRRDFTINSMAISLNPDNYGELVDPFNGQKDIKTKTIRTPLEPEITFSDDPLRMMRAIRFATQLSFDIEPDTFDAICKNVDRLSIVSQERITDELNKIILSAKPSYGFQLLYHVGILEMILPEMVALAGVETIDDKSHKDNFYHTLKVLDNLSKVSEDLWLRWSAILHDIAKPKTKRFHQKRGWTFHGHEDKGAKMVHGIFRRLRLPLNRKMEFVKKLVRLHLRPIALVKDEITDSALRRLLFEAGDDVEDLMKLCRADITSKNHDKVQRYLANFDKVDRKLRDVEGKDKIRNFQPPISGDVIIQTLDIRPSKVIGEIKEDIKEAILEGKIKNNYKEAFDLMLKLAEKRQIVKRNK